MSLDVARAVYADVCDGCGGRQYAPPAWHSLIDNYPNPVSVAQLMEAWA